MANFFVGAGFNSVGIATAGGAGRALAEWIVNGAPTSDLTGVDIRRFAPFNGNNRWLHDRVAEVLGLHYEIPWPNREMTTARPFRRSPVHHLLEAANANFGSRMGWERANFFAPSGVEPTSNTRGASRTGCRGRPPSRPTPERTSPCSTRRRSPNTSSLVRDAEAALQWLCTARRRGRRSARSVYTGMLNERGTYESDVTVTRTGRRRILGRQQRGHHRTRQGPHPQEPALRHERDTRRRDVGLRGVRGDGPELAGPVVRR